jgi:CRISPR-associated endonuclease/helicase Cas3
MGMGAPLSFGYRDKKRNEQQKNTAEQAKKILKKMGGIVVLKGPAGVGKTNISLLTALECNSKKIVFICPRVQICEQVYSSVAKSMPEITTQIFTGDHKANQINSVENPIETTDVVKEFLSAEVVVTTVDQIVDLIKDHLRGSLLFHLISEETLIVFDEIHEMASLPPHFFLLKEIVNLKKLGCKNNNDENRSDKSIPGIMFMSATPNFYFLREILNLSENDNEMTMSNGMIKDRTVSIPSFNEKLFHIKISDDPTDISRKANPGEIIIYNLIDDLQKDILLNNERDTTIAFHSRFARNDKNKIYHKVMEEFALGSDKKTEFALRAGPIAQASLDITTTKLSMQEVSPESTLQRIGRANRDARAKEAYVTIVCHERKNGNFQKGQKKYLEGNYCKNTTKAFTNFLKMKKGTEFTITINEFYELYDEFVEKNESVYKEDFKDFLEDAIKIQKDNKFFRPVEFFGDKKRAKKLEKLPKIALRGASIYVLPAELIWNDNDRKFEYKKVNGKPSFLWNPQELEQKMEKGETIDQGCFFTMQKDDYRFKGDDNILSSFVEKMFKSCDAKELYPADIFNKNIKKNRKEYVFNAARSPNCPLLLSDPEGVYGLGYNGEDKENYGYDFTFDKNYSRPIGIGLIDINHEIIRTFLKKTK